MNYSVAVSGQVEVQAKRPRSVVAEVSGEFYTF